MDDRHSQDYSVKAKPDIDPGNWSKDINTTLSTTFDQLIQENRHSMACITTDNTVVDCIAVPNTAVIPAKLGIVSTSTVTIEKADIVVKSWAVDSHLL